MIRTQHTLALAAGLWLAATALGQATTASAPARQAVPQVTTQAAKQGQDKFEQGRTLFFQGQYAQAADALEQAVRADPTKSGYQLLLAKARRYQGKPAEATALLEAILKANPDHVEAAVELAEILSPAKEPDRVIAVLQPLLEYKHDYPLYHMLAEAYYQKEDWDKARQNYEQAVTLNPASGADHYQLGNIYLAQKRFARAAEAYEKAGQLGIDTAVYHFKLASVYFNLRNYVGAGGTARVVGGQTGQIRNEMLLLEPVPGQKDTFYAAPPRSAIFQIAKARQMGIDTVQIRFLEANTWFNARRWAKADALYKELADKLDKPDQALFWFYWARTAMELEDYDNYLARLNKAIELEPDVYKATLAEAYAAVAARFQQAGDHARYVDYLARAVQTSPLSAPLHLTLGDAYWQAGDIPHAVEQYKLVLELEPDHAERVRLLNRIRQPQPTTTSAPATATAPG